MGIAIVACFWVAVIELFFVRESAQGGVAVVPMSVVGQDHDGVVG